MASARRVFRVLMTLRHLQAMQKLKGKLFNSAGQVNSAAVSTLFFHLGFGLYFFYDTQTLLRQLKLVSGDPKETIQTASKFWLLASVAGAIAEVIEIRKLSSVPVKVAASPADMAGIVSKIATERVARQLEIVKHLGNGIVALELSGYSKQLRFIAQGNGFGDGVVGTAGLVAALVAVYKIWHSCKQTSTGGTPATNGGIASQRAPGVVAVPLTHSGEKDTKA
jgi:hypothetical protein